MIHLLDWCGVVWCDTSRMWECIGRYWIVVNVTLRECGMWHDTILVWVVVWLSGRGASYSEGRDVAAMQQVWLLDSNLILNWYYRKLILN